MSAAALRKLITFNDGVTTYDWAGIVVNLSGGVYVGPGTFTHFGEGVYELILTDDIAEDRYVVSVYPVGQPEKTVRGTFMNAAYDVWEPSPTMLINRPGNFAHWLKATAYYSMRDFQTIEGMEFDNVTVAFDGDIGAGEFTFSGWTYTSTNGVEESLRIGTWTLADGFVPDVDFTWTATADQLLNITFPAPTTGGTLTLSWAGKVVNIIVPTGIDSGGAYVRYDGRLITNDGGPIEGTVTTDIGDTAAIAAAVGSQITSDHGAGSYVSPGTAAAIASAVDGVLTAAHGAGGWQTGGGGTGSVLFTWGEYEAGHEGEPAYAVPDVLVSAYNNAAGSGLAIASTSTDELGEAKFFLDPGTYYLFRRKSGRTFTNPETIEVS